MDTLFALSGTSLILAAVSENPMAFIPPVICLVMLTAHASFFLKKQTAWQFVSENRELISCLFLISALILLSPLWSVRPALSYERSLKAVIIIALGIGMLYCGLTSIKHYTYTHGVKIWKVLSFSAVIILAFLMVSAKLVPALIAPLYDLKLFMLNKPFIILSLCILPFLASLYIQRNRALFTSTVLLVCLCLYLTHSQTTYLIALTAILTLGLHFLIKQRLVLLLAFAWIFVFIALPYLFYWFETPLINLMDSHPEWNRHASPFARIEMWLGTSKLIIEKPLLGYGIGTYRDISLPVEATYLKKTKMLHPHNLPLQIWFEFGLAGIIGTLALAGLIFKKILNMPLSQQRIAIISLNAFLTQFLVSYGLWQSWGLAFAFFLVLYNALAFKLSEDRQVKAPS